MKTLAFYLPQFHRVAENDEWWGEGFTDWVTVKNAQAWFDGHKQPRTPYNNRYYDLMDIDAWKWQANLMKKYGVDGICIYHYWFKDEKQILEKPVEQLLSNKDVKIPYCLYWANESWIRSWSSIHNANAWVEDRATEKKNSSDSGLLLAQDYGDVNSWKRHFDYLLPYFKDDRYICIDGKPLLLIYKTSDIFCLKEMLECWRQCAIDSGLPGIYIIGAYSDDNTRGILDAELIHDPPRSINELRSELHCSDVDTISYVDISHYVLQRAKAYPNEYHCVFPGYDDTPRRGKNGIVLTDSSPLLFETFLSDMLAIEEKNGKDVVFINAWNEWGEGMYLEPDSRYRYKYLDAIKRAKESYIIHQTDENGDEAVNEIVSSRYNKFERYLNLLDIWLNLRELGVSIDEWFIREGIKSIAVYGIGILGRHLITELSESNIEIKYLIDQKKDKINSNLYVYSPKDSLPNCDAIIVASPFYYNEIVKLLPEDRRIISIETILNSFER